MNIVVKIGILIVTTFCGVLFLSWLAAVITRVVAHTYNKVKNDLEKK